MNYSKNSVATAETRYGPITKTEIDIERANSDISSIGRGLSLIGGTINDI